MVAAWGFLANDKGPGSEAEILWLWKQLKFTISCKYTFECKPWITKTGQHREPGE
jgi:hypothetical protein